MEVMLKNVSGMVELLAVAALSPTVKQWDVQNLSKAFDWAKYCEHICSRFCDNSIIRGVMEKQMEHTNRRLQEAFPGFSEVSFLDLCCCEHLLLVKLLHNPDLPIPIMKMLYDTNNSGNGKQLKSVTGICGYLIQCKSACKVLRPLMGSLTFSADIKVQAEMLMEKLESLLAQSSDFHEAKCFLHTVLRLSEGAEGHLCLVIAASLLAAANSAVQTLSLEFLLDWLGTEQSLLQHMCDTLPTAIVKDLLKTHLKFRSMFYGVLKTFASRMEYSITDGDWIDTRSASSPCFQKITENFAALLEACPSMRNSIEDELTALKTSDGDFDVRGLSVWGDILLSLGK